MNFYRLLFTPPLSSRHPIFHLLHGKQRGGTGADGWPAAALAGGSGRSDGREVGESREEVEGDRFPCLPRAEMVQRGRSMGGGMLRQWRLMVAVPGSSGE
jgi:hypothetical protein